VGAPPRRDPVALVWALQAAPAGPCGAPVIEAFPGRARGRALAYRGRRKLARTEDGRRPRDSPAHRSHPVGRRDSLGDVQPRRLQTLRARHSSTVDYLSTVSGGGYIGSCLCRSFPASNAGLGHRSAHLRRRPAAVLHHRQCHLPSIPTQPSSPTCGPQWPGSAPPPRRTETSSSPAGRSCRGTRCERGEHARLDALSRPRRAAVPVGVAGIYRHRRGDGRDP
jgi:hypothetical protein